jgi:tetraacyldisaccharide 4'-kinase
MANNTHPSISTKPTNTSRLQRILESIWYEGAAGAWLLWPLEALFRLAAKWNRSKQLSKQIPHPVPIIIVGNISVGGTGKTPMVIYLVELLKSAGYSPGIITRGYGGKATQWPAEVTPNADPALYGDEPVLMARRAGVPVIVGPERNESVDLMLQTHSVDIIISDDGLQHYRLKRDIEIVLIDAARGLGNKHCLPAGPLREPASRLDECDFVVMHEAEPSAELSMQLATGDLYNLKTGAQQPLSTYKGMTVHAVTGIGNPPRFFRMLRGFGLTVIEHAFPDHHRFSLADIEFADEIPVLMTEKDAVKCKAFATADHWVVPVTATVSSVFGERLLARLKVLES